MKFSRAMSSQRSSATKASPVGLARGRWVRSFRGTVWQVSSGRLCSRWCRSLLLGWRSTRRRSIPIISSMYFRAIWRSFKRCRTKSASLFSVHCRSVRAVRLLGARATKRRSSASSSSKVFERALKSLMSRSTLPTRSCASDRSRSASVSFGGALEQPAAQLELFLMQRQRGRVIVHARSQLSELAHDRGECAHAHRVFEIARDQLALDCKRLLVVSAGVGQLVDLSRSRSPSRLRLQARSLRLVTSLGSALAIARSSSSCSLNAARAPSRSLLSRSVLPR